jgi:hypothetical protein
VAVRKGQHPIQDAGRCGSAEFQLRRDLPDDAVLYGVIELIVHITCPLWCANIPSDL